MGVVVHLATAHNFDLARCLAYAGVEVGVDATMVHQDCGRDLPNFPSLEVVEEAA